MNPTLFFCVSPRGRRWLCRGLAALGLLLAPLAGQAQYKVQVVTRTVTQALPCPLGALVRIRAEKATVRIQGWDQPTARLVLKLSARHPERAVAESELPSARYQFDRHGNTLDLVNFYAVAAAAGVVRSDLRAEYTLWVPAGVRLELRNLYGQTYLSDLTGEQKIEQDFGQITLANLRGSFRATARYADLTAANTAGTFACEAEKSAIRLLGMAGRCTVRNRYGSVLLEPTAELKSAFLDVERTDVTLSVPQPELFNFNLSSAQGSLLVPPRYEAAQRTAGGRSTLQLTNGPALALIRVNTSYAAITLQTTALNLVR